MNPFKNKKGLGRDSSLIGDTPSIQKIIMCQSVHC